MNHQSTRGLKKMNRLLNPDCNDTHIPLFAIGDFHPVLAHHPHHRVHVVVPLHLALQHEAALGFDETDGHQQLLGLGLGLGSGLELSGSASGPGLGLG